MSGIDRQTASRKDGKVNIVIFALKKHAMFTSAFLRFTEMRSELDSVSGLAELNFEIRMKENIWIIEILNAMFVYICVLI